MRIHTLSLSEYRGKWYTYIDRAVLELRDDIVLPYPRKMCCHGVNRIMHDRVSCQFIDGDNIEELFTRMVKLLIDERIDYLAQLHSDIEGLRQVTIPSYTSSYGESPERECFYRRVVYLFRVDYLKVCFLENQWVASTFAERGSSIGRSVTPILPQIKLRVETRNIGEIRYPGGGWAMTPIPKDTDLTTIVKAVIDELIIPKQTRLDRLKQEIEELSRLTFPTLKETL